LDRVGRGNVRTFPYLKLNVRLGWIGLHRRQDVQADLAASDGSSGLSYPGLFPGSTALLLVLCLRPVTVLPKLSLKRIE